MLGLPDEYKILGFARTPIRKLDFLTAATHDQKRYIVSGRSAAPEVTEVVENSVAHGVRAVLEPLSQGADQAFVLVVVAGWTCGFGDAVGVEDEAFSIAGGVLRYGVLGSGEEAQRQTV